MHYLESPPPPASPPRTVFSFVRGLCTRSAKNSCLDVNSVGYRCNQSAKVGADEALASLSFSTSKPNTSVGRTGIRL